MGFVEELARLRSGGGGIPPRDDATRATAPFLWELLTRTEYKPGKPRLVGELVVEASVGCWLVTLREHEVQKQFTVPVETLAGLAGALEAVLASGSIPWRDFKSYKLKNKAAAPKGKDSD
jgi:hypothetical protein